MLLYVRQKSSTWVLRLNTLVGQCGNCANLEIWDVELVVERQVVGTGGGCHHLVPCLQAGLLSRRGDQPELCHGYSTGAAGEAC